MTRTLATLMPDEALAAVGEHADVLHDCVAGNASVNFMWPYARDDRLLEEV